jgi:EpsI family protein
MAWAERRALLAGLAIGLVAAAGVAATPRRHLAQELPPLDLETAVPRQIGSWSMDQTIAPVLPTPDVQAKLENLYNHVLSRTYINEHGERIMFVIAYGADQADRMTLAHLPESCYSSQGFQVSPRTITSIPLPQRDLSVVHLRTSRATRIEPVTYWTTVGNRALVDEVHRRWARARYSLDGIIPDGMLLRVSSIDGNLAPAFERQADFIRQLHSVLAPAVRDRIYGAATPD